MGVAAMTAEFVDMKTAALIRQNKANQERDAKLDSMLRRDWLILEAHGSLCGCSACSWKKILDDMTKGDAK